MSGGEFIAETEKIRHAIRLINEIEPEKFPLLTQRIAAKVHSSTETAFRADEMEKLAKSLSLSEESVQEVIATIEFVYQQACYEMVKPSTLNAKLLALKLDETKAQTLCELWRIEGKNMMERMRQMRAVSACRLRNVNWRLNMTLASDVKSRQKAPNVLMEFNLNNPNGQVLESGDKSVQDEIVHVEFDRDELHEFLAKLDIIQRQLDALSS